MSELEKKEVAPNRIGMVGNDNTKFFAHHAKERIPSNKSELPILRSQLTDMSSELAYKERQIEELKFAH